MKIDHEDAASAEIARRPHHRRALTEAAISEIREQGWNTARFAAICERAQISRTTGYRLCPNGLDDVVALLHQDTIGRVVDAVSARTRSLRVEVRFDEALVAGVQGALNGLRDAPFVQHVLLQKRDLLVGYLLSSEPGAVIDVLGEYAARCAVNFGATAADIRELGRRFVWRLLTDLLMAVPPKKTELPWPGSDDDEAYLAMVQATLKHFVELAEVSEQRRPDLAVPYVPRPAEADLPPIALAVGG